MTYSPMKHYLVIHTYLRMMYQIIKHFYQWPNDDDKYYPIINAAFRNDDYEVLINNIYYLSINYEKQ